MRKRYQRGSRFRETIFVWCDHAIPRPMRSEMVLFVFLKAEIDLDGACEVRQTKEKSKAFLIEVT